MNPILAWLGRRVRCIFRGHRMTPDRIFYPPAKSIIPGYRCSRCGRTQSLLYRWQSVRKDRRQDTDPGEGGKERCRLCGYGRKNHERYCIWTTKSWQETPKRNLDTDSDTQ